MNSKVDGCQKTNTIAQTSKLRPCIERIKSFASARLIQVHDVILALAGDPASKKQRLAVLKGPCLCSGSCEIVEPVPAAHLLAIFRVAFVLSSACAMKFWVT